MKYFVIFSLILFQHSEKAMASSCFTYLKLAQELVSDFDLDRRLDRFWADENSQITGLSVNSYRVHLVEKFRNKVINQDSYVLRQRSDEEVASYQFSSIVTRWMGGHALPVKKVRKFRHKRLFPIDANESWNESWFVEPFLENAKNGIDFLSSRGFEISKEIFLAADLLGLDKQDVTASALNRFLCTEQGNFLVEQVSHMLQFVRHLSIEKGNQHQAALASLQQQPLQFSEWVKAIDQRTRVLQWEELEELATLWVSSLLTGNINLLPQNWIYAEGRFWAIDYSHEFLPGKGASNPLVGNSPATAGKLAADIVLHGNIGAKLRNRLLALKADDLRVMAELSGLDLSDSEIKNALKQAARLANRTPLTIDEARELGNIYGDAGKKVKKN